jgi:hypothetical protein
MDRASRNLALLRESVMTAAGIAGSTAHDNAANRAASTCSVAIIRDRMRIPLLARRGRSRYGGPIEI